VNPPRRHAPDFAFAVPPSWTAAERGEGAVVEQWWTRFESADLNRTVRLALAQNYDIAAAAARLETAAAEARIAGADLYPQLSGGFDAARQRTNLVGNGFSDIAGGEEVVSTTTNSYGVSLDISWELDLWGRVRAQTRAAIAEVQLAQADLAGALLSIAAQSAKAWLALTEARQQVALAEATVGNYRATARQVTDRVEAGVQQPGDMHLALENLASAEALLQQRRQSLDAAARQLEILLGHYPAGRAEGAATLPAVPPPPPVGLPAELIARRPDLVAAERRLAAASERIDAARAALYPRISLTASGGTRSAELGDLLSGDFLVWNVAGNLVQPIFEGGRLRARVAASRGRSAEAVALFAQQALGAFSEVETALRAAELLRERERVLRVAAEQARKAVEVAQNRYGQGVETFIVVLESQRRALDAESAVISVRRLRLANRVDLHLALGGGFDETMPENPEGTGAGRTSRVRRVEVEE
jgi:NodT family efflux transporter outer membrane factor (OMF) lipoprotein